jgi:DNA-directed RNA polymerase specialized sigma24 family protein
MEVLNLKTTPYTKYGDLRKFVAKLCEFFSCSEEDLFPPQHLIEPLETNKGAVEADMEELTSGNLLENLSADSLLLEDRKAEAVSDVMSALTFKEKYVIERYFGINGHDEHTDGEIGETLGLSSGRVQQIRQKALRKMRHPSVSKQHLDLIDEAATERLNRRNAEELARSIAWKKVAEEDLKFADAAEKVGIPAGTLKLSDDFRSYVGHKEYKKQKKEIIKQFKNKGLI